MKSIKIIALLLTLVMILTFAVSCNGNNGGETTTTTTTSSTSSSSSSSSDEGNGGNDDPAPVEMVKVTFYNEDGSVYKEEEVAKDEKITLPEAQQLKAKKFEGWIPEGLSLNLLAGMEYKIVKQISFTASYSDVIPVVPADYESTFEVLAGETKEVIINPYVLDKSVPIVLTFKYAQNGMPKGHQNCILRINGTETLKLTSGYANFVLTPGDNQKPVGGQGWWSYKGTNYPDETAFAKVTINAETGDIKFEIGYNQDNIKYSANIKLDGLSNQIQLVFGHVNTPNLTIKDFKISATTEDGVELSGSSNSGWQPEF